MRINNNIMALNAHRQLGTNQANGAKSMERLSSGLRINRAGDDAAGLAISEKMRGQIRGLKQAARNSQDAISLIQTAEGALNETHAILQRMRELATQSASDTNTEVDRGEIQKEINELAAEITRIAETTEFNTQNLLGGDFSGTFHIGANEGQNILLSINAMDADSLGVAGEAGVRYDVEVDNIAQVDGSFGALDVDQEYSVSKFDETVTVTNPGSGADVEANYALLDADGLVVAVSADGEEYFALDTATAIGDAMTLHEDSDANVSIDFGAPVVSGTVSTEAGTNTNSLKASSTATITDFAGETPGIKPGEYTVVDNTHPLISGTDLGLADKSGNIAAISSDGIAWTDLQGNALFSTSALTADTVVSIGSEGGIDVSTQEAADEAITVINNAIETVSAERSKLGAYQNRLEHTIANLGTSAENLQAAESRIRDLDMAEEIMAFTKNNILQQAATAMLAQANMAPQSVLQLLG